MNKEAGSTVMVSEAQAKLDATLEATRRAVCGFGYKDIEEPQPQPLPRGTGVVGVEHRHGEIAWYPVFLAKTSEEMERFHYFHDPYPGRAFLAFKSRKKAIGYLWRRARREDLEFSRDWKGSVTGKQYRLDYHSSGIPGNLYQHCPVTVAEAAERLAIPRSFILKLIRDGKVKARLVTGKTEKWCFHNYYRLDLAGVEAYLDIHGYGKDYPSMAERQRQLGTTRRLPAIVWCV